LLSASLLGAAILVLMLWYITTNPNRTIVDQILLMALGGIMLGGLAIAGFGVGGIILTIIYARDITAFHGPMRIALNIFFPLVLVLGNMFLIDKDRIKSSFIEVNNFLVRSKRLQVEPEQILLLAPHCLQNSDCPHKITIDTSNCQRCGNCSVSDLLALQDKYGIKVGVATGGTLARKFVQEHRPKAIIAIACERDLTSGIQDANPIPVLGVTNYRPCGPCFNTAVSLPMVEEAICFFMKSTAIEM